MGDCLLAEKLTWYVTSRLGQLSLPSLWGRLIKYQLIWLGLKPGAFIYLCDPIWQVMLRSAVMCFL